MKDTQKRRDGKRKMKYRIVYKEELDLEVEANCVHCARGTPIASIYSSLGESLVCVVLRELPARIDKEWFETPEYGTSWVLGEEAKFLEKPYKSLPHHQAETLWECSPESIKATIREPGPA